MRCLVLDDISIDIASLLQELIEVRKISHRKASENLQRLFNRSRGFSARTIRRLCATNNIRTRSIEGDSHLDRLIRVNVAKVYYMHESYYCMHLYGILLYNAVIAFVFVCLCVCYLVIGEYCVCLDKT